MKKLLAFLLTPIAALYEKLWMLFAVVTVKSTVITNADATPPLISRAHLGGAGVRHARGVVTATSGDSIASVYRFFRVKSNDIVSVLRLDNASWGASCTADFGLYRINGGAVVDADFFASAVDMNTANRGLDITRESGVITVANFEKRIWELLGLSSDPMIEYEVCATLVAAAAATGAGCLSGEMIGAS